MCLSWVLMLATFPVSICFCIKVIQEYERAVVFRLGRLIGGGARGPGECGGGGVRPRSAAFVWVTQTKLGTTFKCSSSVCQPTSAFNHIPLTDFRTFLQQIPTSVRKLWAILGPSERRAAAHFPRHAHHYAQRGMLLYMP